MVPALAPATLNFEPLTRPKAVCAGEVGAGDALGGGVVGACVDFAGVERFAGVLGGGESGGVGAVVVEQGDRPGLHGAHQLFMGDVGVGLVGGPDDTGGGENGDGDGENASHEALLG